MTATAGFHATQGALEYLRYVAGSSDIRECWHYLCDDLASFGFTRLFYARRPGVNRQNLYQLWDSLILSTYGPEVDAFLVEQRCYATESTVIWALEHEGPVSWQYPRDQYQTGELSAAEVKTHLRSAELGLHAGYTYGMPMRAGEARSGFGLWFGPSDDQRDADKAWTAFEAEIVARLYCFDIAVSRYRYVPPGQLLSEREREVLQMAGQGKTITEIAEIMAVHRRTVDDAMNRSRAKLQVATTLQAVLKAEQQGQI